MSYGILVRAAAETLRVSIPTSLEGVLNRAHRSISDRRIDDWSRRLVEQAGIQIETEGLEHDVPNESFVVMSNHQSLYDIPVLFQALKRQMRMVAKKELFLIPFFGSAMLVAEFVKVDRKNRRQALAAMDKAKDLVQSGLSIWIAPEGTRSEDGGLGVFKKGGFHLALGSGARILPVTLSGTSRVLPAQTLNVTKGVHVRVSVSPPVNPQEYGKKRLDELVAVVRSSILGKLSD